MVALKQNEMNEKKRKEHPRREKEKVLNVHEELPPTKGKSIKLFINLIWLLIF